MRQKCLGSACHLLSDKPISAFCWSYVVEATPLAPASVHTEVYERRLALPVGRFLAAGARSARRALTGSRPWEQPAVGNGREVVDKFPGLLTLGIP